MDMAVEWFDIPFYSYYQVTATGLVRRKSDLTILKQFENKTSKGTYLTVAVIPDGCKRKTEGVHRLVCLAFHGVHPSYPKIDVNHKDGDKHNNIPTNLEWMTRAQNVKHSFDTGMRNDSMHVMMTDHLTNEKTTFVSMAEVAKYFNLKHKKGFHLVMKYRDRKYKDRYTFEHLGEYIPAKRGNSKAVYCMDFVNGRLIRCQNLGELEHLTGLRRGSVQDQLSLRPDKLLNGCLIWEVTDPEGMMIAKSITQDAVNASVNQYRAILARGRKEQTTGYLIKNYVTDEVTEVKKITDVIKVLSPHGGGSSIKETDSELRLFNGHAYKRISNPLDWNVYPEAYVQLSLKFPLKGKVVKITDLHLNTTEYFPSLSVFARSIGQDPESVRQKFKKGTLAQYRIESV